MVPRRCLSVQTSPTEAAAEREEGQETAEEPVSASTAPAPPSAPIHAIERNPGMDLDMAWAKSGRINRSGLLRRCDELGGRRSIKSEAQAAWLLKALTCMDLTTLAGDDTPGNVHRLCAKARDPVRPDILEALGVDHLPITTAAVCVYPARVADAVAALEGTNINVAAVATGFPSGQIKTAQKLDEIRGAVADGATEIDIVLSRDLALRGDWEAVYEEVCLFREACGEAHMKTILATGDLGTYKDVHIASMVCMMAGADFIKTSTGKEATNATLPVSLVMLRCIREYRERTGYKIGFKPAGGISSAKSALVYQALMKDELGDEWLENDLFRFGASSLLLDIERQLYHAATKKYAGKHYMPMG